MINETMVTVPEVGKKVTVQTGQEKKVYKRAMCKMPVGERKRFRKSPSGSSDGSPSAVPLRVFHPEEADRIAVRIQQELDTKLFTLKNKIYKDYMPEIVGWHRSGAELARGGERPVISSFRRKPICFLNAAERGLLEGLPPIEQINFKHITDDATRALLIDTITSVANKVLFLLLVEYKSWYLQKNVRGELSLQIAQLIWGDKTTPQAVDFVRGFIDERSRNFRDVVSRVFKRNAIRNAS
ncbi:hypothetical protein GNI_018680 [Gregarina niphandrodes]|uniref:Uncharacterized protein n=1 Tax=Gregarina niphandrodes TaxID=110365 RepID=A0A023BC04_GRENI|nr:hypothetical protein GNI_018680 [Gregarina niphandrodes]EZG81599.1 hypothetical protein GNI_018680 [Gregarina niphandrodes]|eukprot:XP_011134214.1 hypothetical protein GNI_018680 [Gregarina niphandrodes]